MEKRFAEENKARTSDRGIKYCTESEDGRKATWPSCGRGRRKLVEEALEGPALGRERGGGCRCRKITGTQEGHEQSAHEAGG